MANEQLELLLKIKTDVAQAVRDLQRTEKEILDQGKAADSSKRKLSGMAGAYKGLIAAVGAYVSLQAAKEVLLEADAYQVLQQRIKTATRDTGDYIEVSRRLFEITQDNGVALRDTVATFQSFARAGPALGATNKDMLVLTDTIQKLGVIGGSSGQQLSAGLLQFSQLLVQTKPQAEEVNSILENIPELAVRIEKGLGLMPGTLKEAIREGRILTRDVFRTLRDQSGEIRREFEEIEGSLERAAQRFGNSVDRALGRLLAGQKSLTGFLAAYVDRFSQALDVVTEAKTAEQELNALRAEALDLTGRIAEAEERLGKAAGIGREGLRRYLAGLKRDLDDVLARMLEVGKGTLDKPPEAGGSERGTPPPDPDAEKKRKAREALLKQIDRTVQALEIEAATYGQNAEQAALYELRLRGATEAQLQRAQAALQSVAADEAFEEAVRRSEAAVKAQNEAYQDWDEGQRQYLDAVIASVDPTFELTQELEKLDVLMNQFPDHADLIAEAMLNVHERMDALGENTQNIGDKMSEFAKQASRNMQTAFADFLFDPFDEGIQGMLRGFVDTLRRMAAELVAQQALKSLFGGLAGGAAAGSGGWGGFFASLAASVAHQGGIVGAGGPTRQINPFAFINAPRYHDGGVAGLKPNEVPIIAEMGEEILSRTDPRNSANGGQPGEQRFIFVDDERRVADFLYTPAGEKAQVEFITRNASTIKQILR